MITFLMTDDLEMNFWKGADSITKGALPGATTAAALSMIEVIFGPQLAGEQLYRDPAPTECSKPEDGDEIM